MGLQQIYIWGFWGGHHLVTLWVFDFLLDVVSTQGICCPMVAHGRWFPEVSRVSTPWFPVVSKIVFFFKKNYVD